MAAVHSLYLFTTAADLGSDTACEISTKHPILALYRTDRPLSSLSIHWAEIKNFRKMFQIVLTAVETRSERKKLESKRQRGKACETDTSLPVPPP